MRILHVNHGFPPQYNAGSEVYCRNLAVAQSQRHEVAVFAREEDPHRPDYVLRRDVIDGLAMHLANMPRSQHRYQHDDLDQSFEGVVSTFRPDVVHIHHLNHLSLGLPRVAVKTGAAVVFTAHDFWLACPRGQLVQWALSADEPWKLCDGQDDLRCARTCYARCQSGTAARADADVAYWSGWVADRMQAVAETLQSIHAVVCPSRTVAGELKKRFPELTARLLVRDYGFPSRPRVERKPGPFTFGYIGTHVPVKGVDRLIRAFKTVSGDVRLRIWGRYLGQPTDALRRLAAADERISFSGEYTNADVSDVLAQVDAIVVPSIWLENSPLVIHEAQQARVCVVTANAGGMAEYVRHEVNGLLFEHRSETDLAHQLRRLVQEPGLAERLGTRGYLHSEDGSVPSSEDEVRWFDGVYASLRGAR